MDKTQLAHFRSGLAAMLTTLDTDDATGAPGRRRVELDQ